jgi:ABC-type glycerol-3-phosphate transport system substrate-binding protein
MLRIMAGGAGAALVGRPQLGSLRSSRVFAQDRAFTPTYYDWIQNLHPSIAQVDEQFEGINPQVAASAAFSIDQFVVEAKQQESSWDVYVGMTPFVEMTQLIEADVIEPWDNYIPKEVLDDIIPSIREECTIDGKLYSWPFLLDIIGMAWNSNITEKAGITEVPENWDQYLEFAQKIVDSGAAPFGATFDAHGWRSLAPYTYSLSTDVYREDGTWDFTNDAVVEALMLMKKIMALSHPDILLAGASDAGVNGTPDEVAFAAGRVGYYTKYFNAPTRFASAGGFLDKLGFGHLPAFSGGEGYTAFWTTGACLLKYGQNKETAAEYLQALTYDENIWKDSIAGVNTGTIIAQLPPYLSKYAEWDANKPEWMQDYVGLMRDQLEKRSKAINNHAFGLQQFVIGQAGWETYLKGEEADPKVALQKAQEMVDAEIAKAAS